MVNASHSSPLLDEWVLLTKARRQEGHLPVAIEIARFYVQEFPDRFTSHQLLADLLQKSGSNRAARTEANIAIGLQPHGSTAANILSKATFTESAATFLPGDYRLEINSQSQPATTVLLHLLQEHGTWTGSVKAGDDSPPLREIYAGGDQLWFKAGQDFQEKEIRLSISSDGKVSGSWWSAFGRNGAVTGKKVP